ncbi:hypothetical protein CA267_001250 [Alteromonas pelagimontana]|uniref:Lipoprotein n=1 Tax=Alteromonas pelagimontana TaxID=1858656 RepID=A0A6M4M8Q2_9ALTE|nr:hypothetical protein [Alteromonas pelagimontana]QJR79517.1 hypothetical protein CA267_001250 [Alteromonas pelagimontana]
MILRTIMLCLILSSCSTVPTSGNKRPVHYDSRSFSDEDHHTYLIETDSEDVISFEIRISNAANDTSCEKRSIYSTNSVSAKDAVIRHFGFSRKGSPNIALYEWHMCFIHDGITYKAWRGFDPGPNTSLNVNCFITAEQLVAEETDKYLCKTDSVIHSKENYSEVAQHCWSKGVCRRFESAFEYNIFRKRGADNVALHQIVPSKKIRELTVNYEYLDEKKAEKFRSSWISEEQKYCSETDEKYRKLCLEGVSNLKASLAGDGEWRYRLTEKALTGSFPELKPQSLLLHGIRELVYATTFTFTPHKIKGSSVFFYFVTCPIEKRQAKKAVCILSINQAFYSDNPNEYIYIEQTSDLSTALWAYSAHKGVEVDPADERMATWLEKPSSVSSIEIDGMIAKFTYHVGGCTYQTWYRIVGDNEELEFMKVSGGLCI